MARCNAKTAAKRQCLNHSEPGEDFCHRHSDQVSGADTAAMAAGAAAGHLIVPVIGGLVGAVAGPVLRRLFRDDPPSRRKVFVSFDFDHDRALKDFIIGQSRLEDSPFDISDFSLKEAAPDALWEDRARSAIARSDLVIVMVGRHTHRAPGVLKEVAMARAANKPIMQVIGYSDGSHTSVPNAGRLYAWNWNTLRRLLG